VLEREAGVLLSVTSLPSPYGIGCCSESAYRFVDLLAEAGQRYWQILPLGPTGYGNSPYQSFSAFAGNPYLIDLEGLIAEGLLTREECEGCGWGDAEDRVDYGALYAHRFPLLRLAFERSRGRNGEEEARFRREQGEWLEDYALFMACKDALGGAPLSAWAPALRGRDPLALAERRETLAEEVDFHVFLQFRFFEGWRRLREYANGRGIRIIGDLPIYVSADSADLWCHSELFQLDERGAPTAVAGCPPDEFSETGQLWGNPLYDWKAHRREDYGWWIARMKHAFSMYDVVRIDHFRGFDEYYAIPADAVTAKEGRWEKGPGMELFSVLEEAIGHRDVIAEDLGFITESVRALVRECGFDGMKVLQMGLNDTDDRSEHLPHEYPPHCVAYTGTHDNPTLRQWLGSRSAREEARIRAYLRDRYTPMEELCELLVGLVMRSAARRCIIPLQDYLEIGERGCMNRPSTQGENWQWRIRPEEMDEELKQKIRSLTAMGGRLR